jgi:hypothetical protein
MYGQCSVCHLGGSLKTIQSGTEIIWACSPCRKKVKNPVKTVVPQSPKPKIGLVLPNPYMDLGNKTIYFDKTSKSMMPPINEDLPLAGSVLLALQCLKCEFDINKRMNIEQLQGTDYSGEKPERESGRYYFFNEEKMCFFLGIAKKSLFFDLSFLGKNVVNFEENGNQVIPLVWWFVRHLKQKEIAIIWRDLN